MAKRCGVDNVLFLLPETAYNKKSGSSTSVEFRYHNSHTTYARNTHDRLHPSCDRWP